ncbi:MAG: ArsC family reductase [Gammaproteobacteria bacterium]|nr:ArsC family reductase [Gammaproteobacteria bacterium]
MTTLYGIPNCDTMKKARQWLADHHVEYVFHDYKKQGVPEKELKKWVAQLGWETLLNQRGTTWRQLDESVKSGINQTIAIKLMLENPSTIKRPVLDKDGKLVVGFSDESYKVLVKK